MLGSSRGGLRRTILVAVAALVVTVIVVVLLSARTSPPSIPSASPTGGSTPAPTATVACSEEPGDLALGLTKPACPTAILAVQLAVAPVRLPIERIVIQPGPLYCDVLWPGVQTAAPGCRGGYAVSPGQFMHAWIRFAGSQKIAVVMMGLDLPEPVRDPGRTRPPWQTTLVTVEIPPTGWVMP